MKYTTADIAIVILNWNGKALLEQFLPSVLLYSENAKVYVADNASTDDSVVFLENTYPNITLIKNEENGGYAKGYNDALKHVEEPLLCLLNSDIEVTKDWLTAIVEAYNSDTETAIIQPKIRDFKQQYHFEYAGAAGGFIDKYGYPFCRGRIFDTIEKDNNQYNTNSNIFWASGACFFITKTLFNTLNGFDETYFAHMEEIDLCWRAYNTNAKIDYVYQSVVYHVGGATLNQSNPKKTFLNFRNSLYTLVKNTDKNVFSRTFTRLLLDGIAALRFLLKLKPLHVLSILKAHFYFYHALPQLLKYRKTQSKKGGYYYTNSIVWSYFLKHKKTFKEL